jgi:hypothetical protein
MKVLYRQLLTLYAPFSCLATADYTLYQFYSYNYNCSGDMAHCTKVLSGISISRVLSKLIPWPVLRFDLLLLARQNGSH